MKIVECGYERPDSRPATVEDYAELEYQLANVVTQLARLQAALIEDLVHKKSILDEA